MIRVYLDWNAVSHLGREENKELLEYLLSLQDEVLFPCSHAHIYDLLKGGKTDNPEYDSDLSRLKQLSNDHFFYIEKDQVSIHIDDIEKLSDSLYEARIDNIDFDFNTIIGTLDDVGNEFDIKNVGSKLKTLLQDMTLDIPIDEEGKRILNHLMPGLFDSENYWELIQKMGPILISMLNDSSGYKKFTKDIRESGYSVSHMMGDWSVEDVISNIDKYISQFKPELTFQKVVNIGLKKEEKGYNQYIHYQTSYMQLGFLGYRQDKMKNKNDNWWNMIADIDHSYLGGFCDVLVSSDTRMIDKTNVLYKHYNCLVDTIQLDDLKKYLHTKLNSYEDLSPTNITNDLENKITNGVLVEEFTSDEHDEVKSYTKAYKIEVNYFNYFTHIIKEIFPEINGVIYSLRHVNKNFNRSTFYTETKHMVRRIEEVFNYKFNDLDVEEFIYGNEVNLLSIPFNNAIVNLETEVEFGYRPALSIIIGTSPIESKI